MGVRGIEIAPKIPVEDGINAARLMLARCWFDSAKCGRGIEALKNYRQKIDEKRQISTGPLHDWASHGADAFRYLAVSANGPRVTQQPLRLINRRVA
jgi:phage terminase large subunit